MCNYCKPGEGKELIVENGWSSHGTDETTFENAWSAYICDGTNIFELYDKQNCMTFEINFNFCPMCGDKLPERVK